MKAVLPSFLVILALCTTVLPLAAQQYDRAAFYTVMASSSTEEVDAQLNMLKTATIKERDAYEGALLMKKAGLVGNSKNKLNLFRSGRKLLDGSLSKDGDNPELRFLRLMIQENAPHILNYHRELKDDSQYISKFFKKLSPVVQKAVIDYSKKSKILNPELL